MYCEPWHADIFDWLCVASTNQGSLAFAVLAVCHCRVELLSVSLSATLCSDLRKNHGKEEARARDLFYALWIPDEFMRRVEVCCPVRRALCRCLW